MYTAVFWIRIRMDPGFFADPYPDLKNLDSDPSINKPKGCQWCFWLGFGVTWPKRKVLRVLNVKFIQFYLYLQFKTFFSWIRIFGQSGSGFSANPDPKINNFGSATLKISVHFATTVKKILKYVLFQLLSRQFHIFLVIFCLSYF